MGFITDTTSTDTKRTNTRERLLFLRVTSLRVINLVYNGGHPLIDLNALPRTKCDTQGERQVVRILL
jgi:hypothetical protein